MDLKGSLVDTQLKIYPTENLLAFLKTISEDDVPSNILRAIGKDAKKERAEIISNVQITIRDFENMNKIKNIVREKFNETDNEDKTVIDSQIDQVDKKTDQLGTKANEVKTTTDEVKITDHVKTITDEVDTKTDEGIEIDDKNIEKDDVASKTVLVEAIPFLTTSDIDWLYTYLQKCKSKDEKVPYLHDLLAGANIEVPENKVIKRNPVLEARCVKLRAQQEAREYRKMTKTVDNVRLRFPEDSISYQMKQLNRQLIAIGQFIISIFAGFLFGFRGIEWMVGNLDFGFRLLLGVMCALVIALAEIYFLAKKLNEELNIPETTQLGGPPKFVNEEKYMNLPPKKAVAKEHQD